MWGFGFGFKPSQNRSQSTHRHKHSRMKAGVLGEASTSFNHHPTHETYPSALYIVRRNCVSHLNNQLRPQKTKVAMR